MLVSQIGATACILFAVVAFVSVQFVTYEGALNWIDRLGMVAATCTLVSAVFTVLAMIWGL